MKNQSAIIIVIAIAALFISYNAFVVVPQQRIEAQRVAQEKEALQERIAEGLRQLRISECIDNATTLYSLDWDRACEAASKKPDCGLPSYRAKALEDSMDNAKALCLKRY